MGGDAHQKNTLEQRFACCSGLGFTSAYTGSILPAGAALLPGARAGMLELRRPRRSARLEPRNRPLPGAERRRPALRPPPGPRRYRRRLQPRPETRSESLAARARRRGRPRRCEARPGASLDAGV